MKKLLFLVSLIMLFGASAHANALTDIEGHVFEKEILILQSLDIVSGDENAQFHPDERVKRSEAAKLIVEAFSYNGMTYNQQTTDFSDVPESHWASGYISSAAEREFINGVGNGNFAPDDEITFEQACAVIVRALGYEMFAESSGGYPSGHTMYAQSLDITTAMTASNKTPLTKGELAYMLANAMETPVTETENGYLIIMQGKGADYLSPMIKYHKSYFVSGMITATSRSSSIPKQYVDLEVSYARRLGSENINIAKTLRCKTVDGDAIYDLLYRHGEFILKETDDDTYEIIMIIV